MTENGKLDDDAAHILVVDDDTRIRTLLKDFLSEQGYRVSTAANAAKKLQADLCWFDEHELNPARKYVLKHTTATVFARVSEVERVLDVHTLSHETGRKQIALNDIGTVSISLQKPIVCDAYGDNPATGAFILVDEATHHTVAAGMIRAFS